MFSKLKASFYNVVGSFDPTDGGIIGGLGPALNSQNFASSSNLHPNALVSKERPLRFPYTRPYFLQLNSDEEVMVTADHGIRPIICPRDISCLPWNSGYAETINAGKSKRNEDQASIHVGLLTRCIRKSTFSNKESAKDASSHFEDSSIAEVAESSTNLLNENLSKTQETLLNPKNLRTLHNQGIQEKGSNSYTFPNNPKSCLRSHIDDKGQLKIYLPYYYFGVFDGHAGWGAAVSASNQLHHIIHDKLCDVIDLILPNLDVPESDKASGPFWYSMEKSVSVDHVIIGALEKAFWMMDKQIGEDRIRYQLNGGCTACIGLFIFGKLYVANAGDSRAVLGLNGAYHSMSFDFTPETETQRIRKLGALHPELLGGEFTHLEFLRRPLKRDLGKRAIYRDHYMSGWAYKTIKQDDLKYPLVSGEGKRSRVLATIGVTRGFGDHDLKAQFSSLPIKPFLSPEPEVRVFDLTDVELSDRDVLILATDGLWDITSSEKAVDIVCNSLEHFPPEDYQRIKYRYTGAAQDLVMGSRGKLKEHNWRTAEDKHATIDDISAFVIPLKPYQDEYKEWSDQYYSLIKEESLNVTTLMNDLSIDIAVPAYQLNENLSGIPTSVSEKSILCTREPPQLDPVNSLPDAKDETSIEKSPKSVDSFASVKNAGGLVEPSSNKAPPLSQEPPIRDCSIDISIDHVSNGIPKEETDSQLLSSSFTVPNFAESPIQDPLLSDTSYSESQKGFLLVADSPPENSSTGEETIDPVENHFQEGVSDEGTTCTIDQQTGVS